MIVLGKVKCFCESPLSSEFCFEDSLNLKQRQLSLWIELWSLSDSFLPGKKSFVSQWITNFLLQILSDSPAPLQSVLAIAPFISRTIHLNIVSFLGPGNTGINININVNINFDINFDTNLDINIIINLFYYAQLSNTAFFWGIIWKSDYFDFS